MFALALLLFFASDALAQETSAPNPPLSTYEKEVTQCPCLFETRHVLSGHAFLPMIEQPAPFADSRATLSVGVGQGSYGVNVLGANQTVDLISFSPLLNVQVAIIPRLAVFGAFNSNITSGLNSESALIYGGSVRYAWSIGALYELIRTEASVLSFAFQMNKPHTLAVSPLSTAVATEQAAVNSINPDIVNDTVSTEYRPNLRFAHGFNPSLGIQLSIGADFRSTINNGNSTGGTLLTAAIGLTSDLNPWISVPIGFTLAFSRNQIISRSESNSDIASIGIWDTVTHRFNVGAEIGWLRKNGIDSTVGAVLARTYYN